MPYILSSSSIMENTYTLFDLQEHVRRVVALNFAEPLWFTCEVAQCNESKGQHYLALVQKSEQSDAIVAQVDAILWARSYRRLKQTLGKEIDDLLQAGMQVRMQARLDFHERYGLKFFIEDLDLAYTVGQLELKKRATIAALQKKDLLRKNAAFQLPNVLQSIAVLSSENAAGLQDFLSQIQQNPYAYRFKVHLFPTAMQGEKVQAELLKQLKKINRRSEQFDVVIIIRGGGARLDLKAFDDLKICEAVAKSKLPILTGIGHDIDESVLDLVAHTALKTPTAVADFLLQHNARFEAYILEIERYLQLQMRQIVQQERMQLNAKFSELQFLNNSAIRAKQNVLQVQEQQLPLLNSQILKTAKAQLAHQTQLQHFLSLEQTLARGFSLVTKENEVISSADKLSENERVQIRFQDGTRTFITDK